MKLIIFYIFVVNSLITKGEVILWECKVDEDCFVGTCSNGLCSCPTGQILSIDKKQCLPLALGIGKECQDDNQCMILNGRYACINGACQCSEGSNYIRGRCVISKQLGDQCDSDEQCYNGYDVHSTQCTHNICTCRDGYKQRKNYDCRKLATMDDLSCGLDFDCQNITNATCINYKCNVNLSTNNEYISNIYQFKQSTNKEEIRIEESCESDKDCSQENTYCSITFKKCICKRGFTFKDEICKAELGTPFDEGTASCVDGKYINGACYCSGLKAINTADLKKCIKIANHATMQCVQEEGCFLFGPYSKCSSKKCTCQFGYKMNDDLWCEETEHCSSDSDCKFIENSICNTSTATCVCKENAILDNKVCKPVIGGECSTDDNCYVENSSCLNNTCHCNDNYVNINGTCFKAVPLNGECEETSDCENYDKNSKCIENMCKCQANYININGICHPKKRFGDFCSATSQCIESLNMKVVCQNSICQCMAGFKEDGENLCIKSAAANVPSCIIIVVMGVILNKFLP